ncbi:phosphorylcholine phosphatase [Cutaneotrichosporon oleaginosum]|uniref:Phosphorylcholine phosphatase n=1 Tax=Cutaneotrichosporon oleaginosum TaxID=879819 RepID=A0A0J1B2V2_9TREE|nr:phosphorylcholine phosphatase [Cutaneotrichosporon oleaginosum]KLT41919.1 phosphorylcholine phosphatase [Cutaneotrichosporon oleaginosum]TXT12519.1 hypothetical protein COLE_02929 [Cutaneotrichosporon oleaginosum]
MRLLFALPSVLAAAVPHVGKRVHHELAGPSLEHWPQTAARSLDDMIARYANSSNYAIFDWDNTSDRYDLEESLMPYLESIGVLHEDVLDPALRVVPFLDGESMYGYYLRLCEIDDNICYWWAAAVFSGIKLEELKRHVDDLMTLNGAVKTTFTDENGTLVEVQVNTPRIFRGQVELYNRLMANGINVYVISAAAEELVRMVASDPKYGYNVPPENVIGVSLLLNNSGVLTTARKQIAEGVYNNSNGQFVLTPTLWAPATWMTGKWAAVLSYIDQWKLPVLAAGDTPVSDGPMIFHGINRDDGIKLWVNRKASYMEEIAKMNETFAIEQAEQGRPVTADKGWVIVTPDEIQ